MLTFDLTLIFSTDQGYVEFEVILFRFHCDENPCKFHVVLVSGKCACW